MTDNPRIGGNFEDYLSEQYMQVDAPKALINAALSWCPELKDMEGVIIAGGFVRAFYAGEKPADLDLYFESESCYTDALDTLEGADWEEVFKTDKAISYKRGHRKTQAIAYYFGDPETIIKGFDYTICAAALTLNIEYPDGEDQEPKVTGLLLLHEDFFEHLAGRVLWYTGGSPLPLSSLKRAFKYVKRGYHICDENIIALTEAIAERVNFEDEESRDMHIAGMDPDGARRVRVID
jgi:hypothetical protein